MAPLCSQKEEILGKKWKKFQITMIKRVWYDSKGQGGKLYFIEKQEKSNFIGERVVHGCSGKNSQENTRDGVLLYRSYRTYAIGLCTSVRNKKNLPYFGF